MCLCVDMYIFVMRVFGFADVSVDVQVMEVFKSVKNYLKCVEK